MIEVKSHGTKGCWIELQIYPHKSSALCFLTRYTYTIFPLVAVIFTIGVTKKSTETAKGNSGKIKILWIVEITIYTAQVFSAEGENSC